MAGLFNRWSLQLRLLAGFGLICALGGGAAVLAWGASAALKSRQDVTVQAAERLRTAERIHSINAEIFGAEKNMILGGLTGHQDIIDEWTGKLVSLIDQGEKESEKLRAGAPEDGPEGRLRKGMARWSTRCDACHELAAGGGLKKEIEKVLVLSADSQKLMAANQQQIDEVTANLSRSFETNAASTASTYTLVRLLIGGLTLLSTIVALVVIMVVRGTVRRLRHTADQLTEGAEHLRTASAGLSEGAQSLSNGATEQAASLEETSASMEEMSSMTRTNAENAERAAHLVSEVDGRVAESRRSLEVMVTSMTDIQASSQQVSQIIKAIDEIAFQTNILALNAAVEAARAGAAGMGFAVVADEVRNLAQRSAQAARDTAGLIDDSLAKSKRGSDNVEQVAAAIGGIVESVATVKGLIEQVDAASRQQAQGISQVSQAVAQMEKVTQSTAAAAEQSAATSEELTSRAEETSRVAAALHAMLTGGEPPPTPGAAVEEYEQQQRTPRGRSRLAA